MGVETAGTVIEARSGDRVAASNRWGLGYLALTVPAWLLLADAGVAWLRGWRVDSRVDAAVLVAAGAWVAIVTLCALWPAARRRLAQYRLQLLLLSASACMMGLLCEGGLRLVEARVAAPFHCSRPGLRVINHPKPGVMRGVGAEAHASFNSWGMRGSEPPERDAAYRILCLGGSTTACTYLDDLKTWPHVLGALLDEAEPAQEHWVANAGQPGYRAAEHARFLAASPRVSELDCVVVQCGINDFMSCLVGPHPEPLFAQSSLRNMARNALYRWSSGGDKQVEDSAGTVYERRRAIRKAAAIDDTLPRLEPCLEEYARDLQAIVDACRQREVRLIFTTQPVLWRGDLDAENLDLLWFGVLPDGRFLSAGQLRAGMDQYNEVLRRICRDNKLPLADLSDLDGDPAAFYDDCHFTEQGAERVAAALARALAPESEPAGESAP